MFLSKADRLISTLPVGAEHEEGCVIVPTIGAAGAEGATCIITSADARDIHPAALVTLKLYVPGLRFEIVVLEPVPAIAPGLITQVPAPGRPFKTTLPVVAIHEEGWVIVPNIGAVGADGAGLITTLADSTDIHPDSLVTLKLYVPGARLLRVVLAPFPAIEPGLIVQVPVAGRPLSITLPVGAEHEEGCVIVPMIGAGRSHRCSIDNHNGRCK